MSEVLHKQSIVHHRKLVLATTSISTMASTSTRHVIYAREKTGVVVLHILGGDITLDGGVLQQFFESDEINRHIKEAKLGGNDTRILLKYDGDTDGVDFDIMNQLVELLYIYTYNEKGEESAHNALVVKTDKLRDDISVLALDDRFKVRKIAELCIEARMMSIILSEPGQ
ncbi:hypothetical protein BC937DRAFT_90857 [Endogone sp. FLAS-F59071]|nr:hypothetical protein BC937DRAFT_90857 [Endogone sp. FLAS-F59071]|eukprot:RUS16740.1 hypothetical protein BC937DRAFT_90857 [Endogone sp. FLAS-F59071]